MGFDAASMNDITREAGVSKGTIYVYFANKEELFEALIEDERQTIFANLYDALESEGDMRETLIRYGIALAMKITSDKVLKAQRTVISICERMPELGVRFYERGPKRGHDKLAGISGARRRSGRTVDPRYRPRRLSVHRLCMAGFFRQCMFGYRTKAAQRRRDRARVTSGVDVFLKAYAAHCPLSGRSAPQALQSLDGFTAPLPRDRRAQFVQAFALFGRRGDDLGKRRRRRFDLQQGLVDQSRHARRLDLVGLGQHHLVGHRGLVEQRHAPRRRSP